MVRPTGTYFAEVTVTPVQATITLEWATLQSTIVALWAAYIEMITYMGTMAEYRVNDMLKNLACQQYLVMGAAVVKSFNVHL